MYGAQLSTTQVPKPNPKFDKTKPADDVVNPKFLDEKDQPTNDEKKAAKIDDPNLGLTVSALTDRKGAVMKDKDGKESKAVDLADNDLYGALQSQRELLTRSGEFSTDAAIKSDPNAASQRGIPYYQKSLDLLARQFAQTLNDANQGFVYDENGNYVKGTMDADGKITRVDNGLFTFTDGANTHTLNRNDTWDKLPDWVKNQMGGANSVEEYLKGKGISMGVPLFSNRGDRNDTDGITAANISISAKWAEGPQIVRSFQLPSAMDKIPSTESSNIDHMIYLFEKKQDYKPGTVQGDAAGKDVTMFTGSFQEMWSNIGSVLGNDMKVTSTLLDAYYASSVSLDTSRDSVSSVDFNDEAMNLMQYSKSYSAACRLMTTIDSVLDKLINGTGA